MMSPLLDIQNLSLQFPGSRMILENISYQVYPGDFIVILGSNGSGKSSLLKALDKRYPQHAGEIVLDQKRSKDYSSHQFSRAVKTLTQNCNETLFGSLTVIENFLIIKQQNKPDLFTLNSERERDFFADYISKFNPNLSSKLDTIIDRLSGGEKQALALGLTVLYPPRLLLLDEHTAALDPKSAELIMSLTVDIAISHQITCMMTTHDLIEATNYGNRVLALKNGKMHRSIEHREKKQMRAETLIEMCY